MSVYKLFGDVTGGSQDDAASVDVQADGNINAIHGTLYGDLDADGESIVAELSFLSTNTFLVNDARGSLFTLGGQMSLTTSGVAFTGLNDSISGIKIPVSQGERIHLHISSTAGVSGDCFMYLYVEDGIAAAQRRR